MTSNSVRLPYGDNELSFRVDAGARLVGVYTPHATAAAADPMSVIRQALEHPIAAPRLRDSARGRHSALILVDDITRETPVHLLVPALLDELAGAGLPDEGVRVMIALGTHRPMSDAEVQRKLGRAVTARVEVLQHDHRVAPLRDLGVTPNGTPVSVNDLLFEVDLVIGTGSVVPHHIAGYSAGAKIVQPGVSGAATTAATHMFSARASTPLLGQVDTAVRADMERIAAQCSMPYVLNVTLNAAGELVTATFGDTQAAFRRAVEDARAIYGVPVPRGVDIVVAGSHPCDIEFWQAHKSLYPAAMVVRPGGTIIVVTPCPEGVTVTHADLLNYAAEPADRIIGRYERGETSDPVGASLAAAWARVREYAEIVIVSDGISNQDVRALGFTQAEDIEAALEIARARAPNAPSVAVLTHAPDTLPTTS